MRQQVLWNYFFEAAVDYGNGLVLIPFKWRQWRELSYAISDANLYALSEVEVDL